MPPTQTLAQLAESLAGESVFAPGSAAEPTPLLEHWYAEPAATSGLRLLHSFVPGINRLDMAALHPAASVTGLFMQPEWQAAQAAGRFHHLPLGYYGFVRHAREALAVDTCLAVVAPPDGDGRCSLGPAAEFTMLVQARARRTVLMVNDQFPAMPGAPWLPLSVAAAVVPASFPPPSYAVGAETAEAAVIAGHIAGFVDNGCTVQVGLGKVPDALLRRLHGLRRLRLHSGMLSDTALDLMESGAVEGDAVSCVWVGTPELYQRLRGRIGIVVAGCDHTHDPAVLAGMARLRAVNSALSVDLFGQANLETAGGRAVSGLGGAADFARGARAAPGGISIVALPSSYAGGTRSRIVARLDGVASLARTDIDVVVTEHGAADLRGKDVHARAAALIAVAAPAFRDGLAQEWQAIRARL